MIRTLLALMVVMALTAEECNLGDLDGLVNRPGTITVTNLSTDQIAVVAIIAPDVKSYPTIAPGQSASVETNVGGQYQVRVVMTPENTASYRAELQSLRSFVEKQIDGTANAADKTRLFVDLAGIKAAIRALENQNAAGCSGKINLSTESEVKVNATVGWSATSGGGFWDSTCGSN